MILAASRLGDTDPHAWPHADPPRACGRSQGVLVGFHGYKENAAIQLERLEEIPGSPHGLSVRPGASSLLSRADGGSRGELDDAGGSRHRDRRTTLRTSAAALDEVPHDETTPLVYLGFSQGVAMAFRAAVLGRERASGLIAVGGDVPPELLADPSLQFPSVFLARGERDGWLTQSKFDADVAALTARGTPPRSLRLRWRPRMERRGRQCRGRIPSRSRRE